MDDSDDEEGLESPRHNGDELLPLLRVAVHYSAGSAWRYGDQDPLPVILMQAWADAVGWEGIMHLCYGQHSASQTEHVYSALGRAADISLHQREKHDAVLSWLDKMQHRSRLYELVKPRYAVPVHGEWRHLVANADLAIQTGVDPDHVVLAEDGVVVDLVDGRARITGAVPCGYVYVDGSSVGGATEELLKDRRILRDEGFISVMVVVDSSTGKVIAGPEITARGFAEDDEIFTQVKPKIVAALDEAARKGTTDTHQLQQVVRRAVGGWVGGKIRRRPMIIPVVVEA